jgi:adenylate cyclase
LPASTGCPPTRGGCSRRRRCWAPCSTRACCGPWQAAPERCRPRSTGSSRPTWSRRSTSGARRDATGSPTPSCTRRSTRTCSWPAARSCTSGSGARSSAWPARGPTGCATSKSLSADKLRGARYLVAAGDWARAVYANEDAIRHYERALRTLGDCPGGDGDARAARERLADLLGLTGRRADALAHYETVRKEVEPAGDRTATARLQRKIGGLHWDAGDRELAGACFAAGLELLDEAGDPIERAQLFQEMGRLAFRAGDNADAIAWAERALAEAAHEEQAAAGPERAREAAAMRAHAYNTLGVALARTGRATDAVEQIERSIALAEAHDLPQVACRGYTNLGVLYSSLDPRRSIATCLRGLETAKKVGDLGFQSRLYANLAVAYCALTDRCEAEGVEAARAAIDLDRRLGLLDHLAVPLIVLGQIHQCHGEHREAFAMYQEALGLAEQVGEPQLLFPCYDGLATLYLDAGEQATAEIYLSKAQEICARAGLEPDALMVLPFLY